MLTGQLNEHPRAAMKARDEKDTKYREFYRNLLAE
jgi:4-hydroxy 2-oxovalerate aldolase